VYRMGNGSTGSETGHRVRCRRDGGGFDLGRSCSRAVAALPVARCACRWRCQLPRLYRAVALSDTMVRTTTWPGAQHCILRGRHRLDHGAALGSLSDH
jgi:hypothetical protein